MSNQTQPLVDELRVEPRAQEPAPTDDEIAADIDSAEEASEAEAQVHPQGYAEAVARLRDDARYLNWWMSSDATPDGRIRHHLADYLETVGPDGPDVTSPDRDSDSVYLDVRHGQLTVTQTTGRPLTLAVNGKVVAVPDRERTTIELTLADRRNLAVDAITRKLGSLDPWLVSWEDRAALADAVLAALDGDSGWEIPPGAHGPAPKLAQGGIIRRDTDVVDVGEDQLLERLEALPIEPAIASEDAQTAPAAAEENRRHG